MSKGKNGHILYTLRDFNEEEKKRKNIIYIHVKEGASICKQCGCGSPGKELFNTPCKRG